MLLIFNYLSVCETTSEHCELHEVGGSQSGPEVDRVRLAAGGQKGKDERKFPGQVRAADPQLVAWRDPTVDQQK